MTNPYDEVPWRGHPIDGTAPEQLAVASWLQGGPCPDVLGCRVLEIGCGDGANLLPMAWFRPECRFVGVDGSASAIDEAAEGVRYLGLRNVDLRHADLRDVDVGDEPFDFVVAHGVLSWIPADGRAALLASCRRLLAPKGVALVSFNVEAGWIGRGLVRASLLRATAGIEATSARVDRARAVATRLLSLSAPGPEPYAALLHQELARVAAASDAYVAHEYLSPENRAFAHGDLRDLAARHGLRTIGDARFNRPEALPARRWAERLRAAGDAGLDEDDAIDLLGGRAFRHAILARDDAPASDPRACIGLASVACGLAHLSDPFDLRPGHPERFRGAEGALIEVTDPRLKWALVHLAARWPSGSALERIVADGSRALADAGVPVAWGEPEVSALAASLTDLCAEGHVELRLREHPSRVGVPERPIALPITRYEAIGGGPITTPFHVPMPLDPAEREAVLGLDGGPLAGRGDVAAAVAERLGWWGLLTDDQ